MVANIRFPINFISSKTTEPSQQVLERNCPDMQLDFYQIELGNADKRDSCENYYNYQKRIKDYQIIRNIYFFYMYSNLDIF